MSNYLLSNLNIDIISDEIGAFLDKCKVDRKDAMRIKLAAEETLIRNQERFGEQIYKAEKEVMNTVDVDSKYIERVQLGFKQTISDGLGYGYMGNYKNSSGKTGTSQSFIDTNNDGVVDTETITSSFVGYSPSEDPKISIVVVSPDIGLPKASYQSAVTKRISSKLVNKYFSIYK